jgi:uncharacterized protein YdaU (DUF1376 family)
MHLSAAEDGMYGRLLDAGYTSERPLPLDRTILYATVRANSASDRKAVESILSQYFYETKRGFRHRRIDAEITRAKAKSEAYRVSGRKGGLKRQAIAKQSLGEESSENQVSQTLDSRLQTPKSLPSASVNGNGARVALTEREQFARSSFEKFWTPYPKKLDRDATFQRWLSLSPIEQDIAAESVELWVKSEEWNDPQFVPAPENFLKKRRWESKPVQGGKRNVTKEAAARLRAEIESN